MTEALISEKDNPPGHWARPLYERQVAMLGQLAEAGLEVALDIKDQVKAGAGDRAEAALAFGRVSRSVRLTLMLQTQAIKQIDGLDNPATTSGGSDATGAEPVKILRTFYVPSPDGPVEVGRLDSERLDRPDISSDLLSQPVSDLIPIICQDMGLDPDWPNRTREALDEVGAANGFPLEPFPLDGGKGRDGNDPAGLNETNTRGGLLEQSHLHRRCGHPYPDG